MPERAPVDVGVRLCRGAIATRRLGGSRLQDCARGVDGGVEDEARGEIWRSVARDDGEPDGVDDVDDADALSPWPTPLGPERARSRRRMDWSTRSREHTEADEAALAYQYLVGAVGHLLGRHCYVVSDGARQYPTRCIIGVVGATGIGAQGDGMGPRQTHSPDGRRHAVHRIVLGFNSAEGLIDFVHDEIVGKAGKDGVRVIDSPNVEDKRVLVVETEFARMLRVMARDGSTLSAVFRMAFDDGDIHVPSKTAKNRRQAPTSVSSGISRGRSCRSGSRPRTVRTGSRTGCCGAPRGAPSSCHAAASPTRPTWASSRRDCATVSRPSPMGPCV